MKLGAGIFWLLVALLFGGAAYFGVHVARMKEAAARGHVPAGEGAPEARAAAGEPEGQAEGQAEGVADAHAAGEPAGGAAEGQGAAR